MIATAASELPVFIQSESNDIFGVLTEPTIDSNGAAIVLLFGGLYTLSINRNRVTVDAARKFASLGYHVLRLDLHGVGESSGSVDAYDISRPFFGDVLRAADWLRARGIADIVLVGQCYGARTCLAASERMPNVAGIALFSMPVLNFNRTEFEARRNAKASVWSLLRRAMHLRVLRGLFSRQRRARYTGIARAKARAIRGHGDEDTQSKVSQDVVRQFGHLASVGIPTLVVYGVEDFRDEFETVRDGRIDRELRREGARIEVRLEDDIKMHGLPTMLAQQRAIDLVIRWLHKAVTPGLTRSGVRS